MEKALQNNVVFFFAGVFLITLVGFYPTYLVHFPAFEGFSWAYHFHGFIASVWIFMLIAQAYLIRTKNYALHRKVGKAAWLVMPLLLFSFFLVAREMYYKNINVKHLAYSDALAELSRTGLPDILYMAILFSLGMIYKHRTAWHLRFFTCTGLMIMGPGLGRFAFVHFSPEIAGMIMGVAILLTPIIWLIIDIFKKKSPVPLLVFIVITITAINMGKSGHTDWWQAFADWVVTRLF